MTISTLAATALSANSLKGETCWHRKGRRGAFWVLVLAIASGCALRLWRLDNSQLSGDESFSWRMAQYPIVEIFQRTALDVHPPLSYVLLKEWFCAVGDSPFAVRALAAVFGVLAIPLVFATFCEAIRWVPTTWRWAPSGAALVSFLFAIHQTETGAARLGRMYSLGVLFALGSAWLLLRALRPNGASFVSSLPRYSGKERSGARGLTTAAEVALREASTLSPHPFLHGVPAGEGQNGGPTADRNTYWWVAYTLTIAAFCYTHYFAFFTIAAQALFVVGVAVSRWRSASFRDALRVVVSYGYAGLFAAILYAPWLPAFLGQQQAVQGNYGLPQKFCNTTPEVQTF